MGALMIKSEEQLIMEYGVIANCGSCDGIMVPHTKTLHRDYKQDGLILYNFPVMKCLECDAWDYKATDMIKYLRLAKKKYDLMQVPHFDCENEC